MNKNKRKILITGANGLLGNRCACHLRKNHIVHLIVRTKPSRPLDGVHYHEVDLSQNWKATDLPQNIDSVLHLAQSSKFRNFPDNALDVFGVNIASTAKLLDYAHTIGAQHFILASSGGVYGTGVSAFKENSVILPSGDLGYYLGSKLCGEILAQNYAQSMSVITLRFFFMYGEEQKNDMLIPRLVDSVRTGKPITLQGSDGLKINPIYVSDAVKAVEKTLELNESCTINIAGAEIVSLRDIALMIGELIGKEPVFLMQEKPASHIVANTDSMIKLLIKPKVSIREGLARFE